MGNLIPRKKQKVLVIPKNRFATAAAKRDFNESEINLALKEEDVKIYCQKARLKIITKNE